MNQNRETYLIIGTGLATTRAKNNIYVLNPVSTDLGVRYTMSYREESEGSPACSVSKPRCEELMAVMLLANGSIGDRQSGRAAVFV